MPVDAALVMISTVSSIGRPTLVCCCGELVILGGAGAMTSLFNPNDVRLITTELVLTISAFLILGLSVLPDLGRKTWAPVLASLACVSTLASLLSFVWMFGLEALRTPDMTIGFNGMFILDAFSIFFKVVFLLAAMLTILVSARYLEVERAQ